MWVISEIFRFHIGYREGDSGRSRQMERDSETERERKTDRGRDGPRGRERERQEKIEMYTM